MKKFPTPVGPQPVLVRMEERGEEIEERDIKVKLLGDLTTGWAGLGVFSSFPT